jgi:hypothetical protein
VKRAYKFKSSDSRVLEEQALERQLRAAAFMPTSNPNANAHSLSEAMRRPPTFRGVPGRREESSPRRMENYVELCSRGTGKPASVGALAG